jgi:hypothetical protein
MIIAGRLKSPSDGKSGAISPEIRDAVKQILKLPILRSKPFQKRTWISLRKSLAQHSTALSKSRINSSLRLLLASKQGNPRILKIFGPRFHQTRGRLASLLGLLQIIILLLQIHAKVNVATCTSFSLFDQGLVFSIEAYSDSTYPISSLFIAFKSAFALLRSETFSYNSISTCP